MTGFWEGVRSRNFKCFNGEQNPGTGRERGQCNLFLDTRCRKQMCFSEGLAETRDLFGSCCLRVWLLTTRRGKAAKSQSTHTHAHILVKASSRERERERDRALSICHMASSSRCHCCHHRRCRCQCCCRCRCPRASCTHSAYVAYLSTSHFLSSLSQHQKHVLASNSVAAKMR